jgi:tRNA threonylcarbamoyladenosine biosynthesis protein TsaE
MTKKAINLHLSSLEDTHRFAQLLAPQLISGHTLLLEGDLGAGKTTFTKALVAAMGCHAAVSSPTFTLINHYDHDPMIYHIDLYRMSSSKSIDLLDLDTYYQKKGVLIIEWANLLETLRPASFLELIFSFDTENARRVTLSSEGEHHHTLFEHIQRRYPVA